jgi:mannose-6-phosphate isomerase-like protein (cupin superfamily)
MEIRSIDRDALGPENGFSEPLVPWPALSAPFEGAWCVIGPSSSSKRHAHHEHEIFIAMAGEAFLESAGERVVFRKGDIVHFPPHTDHQVINEGTEDFEMYAVWWDSDMASRFVDDQAPRA